MANQFLGPEHISHSLAVLIADELNSRGIDRRQARMETFDTELDGVLCSLWYELPNFSSRELILSIDRFTGRYLAKAAVEIAQIISERCPKGSIATPVLLPKREQPDWSYQAIHTQGGISLLLERTYRIDTDTMACWVRMAYRVRRDEPSVINP